MPLDKVFIVEGDAGELSFGQPGTKVGNHRILNGGITEIVSSVRSQQCDSAEQSHFTDSPSVFEGNILVTTYFANRRFASAFGCRSCGPNQNWAGFAI